jgi:chemotaxis protein histidine kinase CheA
LVMKAVDGRYTQSGLVSGASILGNGRIVLILDVPALFTSAMGKERSRAVRT